MHPLSYLGSELCPRGPPNISHQVKRDPTWAASTFPYGSLHCPHPDFPFVLPQWGNGRLTQTLTGPHRALTTLLRAAPEGALLGHRDHHTSLLSRMEKSLAAMKTWHGFDL